MSETDWDAYKRQQEHDFVDELERREQADRRAIEARAGRDWVTRLRITPESRAEARAHVLRRVDERRWSVPEPGVPGGGRREVAGARLTLEEAKLALSALSSDLESTEDAVKNAVEDLAYAVGLGPRSLLEAQQERDAELDESVDRLWEEAGRHGEDRPS